MAKTSIVASDTYKVYTRRELADSPKVGYSGNYVYAYVYIFDKDEGYTWSWQTDWVTQKANATYRAELVLESESGSYITYKLILNETVLEPPSTPSSITIPTEIRVRDAITISWSSSYGATRYYLERQVNGESWIQIYSGTARSYTDTVLEGWNTVAYRVRAYNSDGYSSYRTFSTITIIHFP